MNVDEFGQKIKNKYPQYASIPNATLTQATLKKYPQYASAVQGAAQPQQPTQQAPQQQPQPGGQPGQPPMGGGQPQGQQPFNPPQMDQATQMKIYKMFPQLLEKRLAGQMSPSTQKQSSPWRVVPGMIGDGGKPLQQNEQTGEVRYADVGATPTGRGNAGYGKGEGGVTLKSPTDPSKSFLNNARGRTQEISGMSMIEKNIDPGLAGRNTPVGAAASTVRRAKNGLSLLAMPTVTNAALQAVMGDIDSIVTQGSATVEGRKALAGNNVYAKIQEFKSKMSAHPDGTPVPPGVVDLYKNILNDLGPISQSFIQDRVKQQGEYYRSRGEQLVGKKQYNDMLGRVSSGFTIADPAAKPADNSDLSSMSTEELQKIAAGGK